MPLARREPYCPRCLEPNARCVEVEFFELVSDEPELSAGSSVLPR